MDHSYRIVPKNHIPKLTDLDNMEIIKENDWDNKNYKIVTNGGEFQDSKHLHFHLLSGEKI